MAFNKRLWKGRQGTGLNKFSINGATPVTVINQPDSVTEQGDALSAGNLNDLEQRIYGAFDDIADGTQIVGKATADALGNVIDQTYETKAEASDLKSAIRKDEARITNLEEKADPTGAYKTVQYRGTNDVPTGKAKYALVESIVGKSRAWNQLVDKDNFSWLPYAIGTWSIPSGPLEPNSTVKNLVIPVIGGHKYLASRTIITSRFRFGSTVDTPAEGVTLTVIEPNADSEYSVLLTVPSGANYLVAYIALASDANYLDSANTFLLRDLTPIFPDLPSTDLETSNIPALVKRCPDLLKYDAYGTSIVDTTVEGVKSIGFNRWDGTAEDGRAMGSNGNTYSDADCFATGYIEVRAGESYYINSTKGKKWVDFYDANKTFLSQLSSDGNNQITVPNGACFGRWTGFMTSKSTYCVNLFNSSLNGQYKPYMTDTLTLPTSVTLRSAGSVADTDELNVEVVVDGQKVNKRRQTTRVGGGAIGTGWSYNATRQAWDKTISGIKTDSDLLATNYLFIGTVRSSAQIQAMAVGTCAINGTTIFIKNGSDSVAPSGYLYYALATESVTLLDPIENNTIQTEGGGTINTIQTQTPVIDNCMDVGYLAL